MTGVTHPEIKRLINENYPSAKVILLDEIGFSGPYPAPGVTRKQNEEFKQKLRDMKVDAVLSVKPAAARGRSTRRPTLPSAAS